MIKVLIYLVALLVAVASGNLLLDKRFLKSVKPTTFTKLVIWAVGITTYLGLSLVAVPRLLSSKSDVGFVAGVGLIAVMVLFALAVLNRQLHKKRTQEWVRSILGENDDA